MRLRQIVIVASDLAATERQVTAALGVELCYRDPGVAAFGLRNALFPVGDKLLEIVSPTQPGTTAGRLIDKRGGDSGYMVILEIDDLATMREQIEASGARIVFEAVETGIIGLHLHPGDVGGAILSIDATDHWGEWPWAGADWRDHVRTDVVTDVLAVEIEAHDPAAMAARWATILCRPAVDTAIRLDEGEIRFVPAGDRGEGVVGFEFAAADGAAQVDVEIGGCRLRSV